MRKFYLHSSSSDNKNDQIIKNALARYKIGIHEDQMGKYIDADDTALDASPFNVSKQGPKMILTYDTQKADSVELMSNTNQGWGISFDFDPAAISYLRPTVTPSELWKEIADEVAFYMPNTGILSGFGFGRTFNSSDKIKARNMFCAYARALSENPDNPQIASGEIFSEKIIQTLHHQQLKAHVERVLVERTALLGILGHDTTVVSLLDKCIQYMQKTVKVEQLMLPTRTNSLNIVDEDGL